MVPTSNCNGQLCGAVGMNAVTAADTATFTATTTANRPFDAGKVSGPARNKTMSTTRASTARRFTSIMARRLYTSPGERRP